MHKNVKGTRKIPEVCTSGIFRLKIAQKRKTPEKFKFFGSLWGFFVCSVAASFKSESPTQVSDNKNDTISTPKRTRDLKALQGGTLKDKAAVHMTLNFMKI